MVRVAVAFLLICAFVTFINTARADGLFQESLALRNGQVLVVEESAPEPRSVGTGNYLTRHIYSYTDSRLILQYDETLGCAGPLACDDIGESRWDWSETVPEQGGADNAE